MTRQVWWKSSNGNIDIAVSLLSLYCEIQICYAVGLGAILLVTSGQEIWFDLDLFAVAVAVMIERGQILSVSTGCCWLLTDGMIFFLMQYQ